MGTPSHPPPRITTSAPHSHPQQLPHTASRSQSLLCCSRFGRSYKQLANTSTHHHSARPLFQPSVAISPVSTTTPISQRHPDKSEFMSIENLKTYDPFAEADEDTGETKQAQNYIHIRIQQRN